MGVRFVGVCTEGTGESSLEDVLLLNGVFSVFAVGSLELDWRSSVTAFRGVLITGSGSSSTEGSSSSRDISCSDCAVSQLSFDPALTALSGVGAGYSNDISKCKQNRHKTEARNVCAYLLQPR